MGQASAGEGKDAMTDEKVQDPAVAYLFRVQIDQVSLGLWSSFEGLGWETVIETREEGGVNDFVHQLPGRMKVSNVKITRPLGRDSAKVAAWFASLTIQVQRATAHITAVGPDHRDVVTWSLDGVVPVRWTGPSFNVDTLKVATETLELAHHGFLDAAKPIPAVPTASGQN